MTKDIQESTLDTAQSLVGAVSNHFKKNGELYSAILHNVHRLLKHTSKSYHHLTNIPKAERGELKQTLPGHPHREESKIKHTR